MRTVRLWRGAGIGATIALSVFAAYLNFWIGSLVVRNGIGVDFNQFYSAGRLAGTGRVYDWATLRKTETQTGYEIPTGRLPIVLYGHKVLTLFSYGTALRIWWAGTVSALIAFVFFWSQTRRAAMAIAVACSLPAVLMVLLGQDTSYWLMFFAIGLTLMRRQRPIAAGLAFALCITKFHLTLGLPIMLAAQRRWRTLIAGAAGVGLLIGACFLVEGYDWPRRYLDMAKLPEFSPAPRRMPVLYGIVAGVRGAGVAEALAACAAGGLLWIVCRRVRDIGTAGAAAAAAGLLLSHHAYAYDCLLVIPLAVVVIQRTVSHKWLKAWALLLLSPLTTLLLVLDRPVWGQAVVVGFVMVALAHLAVGRPPTAMTGPPVATPEAQG